MSRRRVRWNLASFEVTYTDDAPRWLTKDRAGSEPQETT